MVKFLNRIMNVDRLPTQDVALERSASCVGQRYFWSLTSVVGVFAHGLVAGACAAESRASKDFRTDHPRLLEQALEDGSNAEREDLATPGSGLRIGEMCGRASGWIIHCMQWILLLQPCRTRRLRWASPVC